MAKSNQETVADMIGSAIGKAMAKQRDKDTPPDNTGQDTLVRNEGTEIILPADPSHMSIEKGIETLQKMQIDQETNVAILERIGGAHFVDGLVAFNSAMREVFGWTQSVTGRGGVPPIFLEVPISVTERARVIIGRFEIPGVDGYVEVSSFDDGGVPAVMIVGEVKKRSQDIVTKLAEATRRIVRESSIYRNKAFELKFNSDGTISSDAPSFVDVSQGDRPIFSKHTEAAVAANIYALIQHSARCRELRIPLKRGILLEGPYGTGKTLLSRQTAQLAVDSKEWTFMLVREAKNLAAAISFARRFQPVVLFVEDIDREMQGDDRTAEMDNILNTLDGVDSKQSEVMVVLTSNHAENINRAMIRPGRLDAVISIEAPDAEAAIRLMRTYAGDTLDPEANYDEVGVALAGNPAAVIREVVERAKLYALNIVPMGEKFLLPPQSLTESAETMKRQLELLNEQPDEEVSPGEILIQAIADRVYDRFEESETSTTRTAGARILRIVQKVGA